MGHNTCSLNQSVCLLREQIVHMWAREGEYVDLCESAHKCVSGRARVPAASSSSQCAFKCLRQSCFQQKHYDFHPQDFKIFLNSAYSKIPCNRTNLSEEYNDIVGL